MRQKQEGTSEFQSNPAKPASTYKTFYHDGRTHFLNEPHWEPGDGSTHLVFSNPIRNYEDYLDQHPDIAFTILNRYDSRPPADRSRIEGRDGTFRKPEPLYQLLSLVSESMIEAVEDFVENVPRFKELFPGFNPRQQIRAPYLFMFHSARYLPDILPDLDPVSQYLITQLANCIEASHGFEHESARAQARSGRVSNNLFGYLIRPGDVLIQKTGPLTQAYVALDWAKETEASRQERLSDFHYDQWDNRRGKPSDNWDPKQGERKRWFEWSVPVWNWVFDGRFQARHHDLEVGVKATYSGELLPIEELSVIPLKYAPADVKERLEKRGRMFWSLRHRRYISYRQRGDADITKLADRFMVDVTTYKKLHPKSDISKMRLRSDVSWKAMQSDNPPEGVGLLVFPNMIPGFNLVRKSWEDLYVDNMSPVVWQKQAFADLVVDDETKELVQALVMKQLTTEQSTDLIAGKGNGLIILLHGGPGTGKTFTAEGVAEFAEKPLLRVTCGDVGAVAGVVERKLQSSFYLGKKWDCVVLLDEADVFLEERDMKDLNRNALVSVFLRELEYHDGILNLTSNRVGTFEEAFKSRIQLSLHYENLGITQRRKIWRNFINRVKILDPTIDYDGIMDHLYELAKVDMNGREIRNAMTTVRQLAQFKEKALSYSHLNHVLRVNGKFGRYLSDLRGGLTEDEDKRDRGLRLSYKTPTTRPNESPF
ncbi:AAA family ATPase [Microdochium trichocladiopsis]|uniref:AAA family ATPase n=1 Tax=Microdochium trichocladiopsis TaxID=1682393 RepID=A0A9P9BMX5_9PEZI|nr:AAA family ATPase [Microdochium trichocladiopsis]KAH7026713.1 AAA family ATPase [Microdochium trichocladiopsis]